MLVRTGRGFGAVALSGLLEAAETNPLAPRQPHAAAKAKSVIYLFMHGGVSHVDTFDPKPELTRNSGGVDLNAANMVFRRPVLRVDRSRERFDGRDVQFGDLLDVPAFVVEPREQYEVRAQSQI